MRRSGRIESAALALALSLVPLSLAGAAPSPYPATLTMQRGLSQSSTVPGLPWGTALSPHQTEWVKLSPGGTTFRWGAWYENGGPSEFPVRSTDGGSRWTAAGPLLATDWAGGSLYYVSKVFPLSASSVVMVSNSIIDVSTNGGRTWYQYLNGGDDWKITAYATTGRHIGLRVSPLSYSPLTRGSFAVYVLNVTLHQWQKTRESLK